MKRSSHRIGIFGGTFDPPHKGHIAIAKQAMKQMSLDSIYFVPAYLPPHKLELASIKAKHRYEMLRLAIAGHRGFKISTIELRRRGISFTVDTLKAFKQKFPKAELVLIIGADNLTQFHAWKSPKTILKLASLAVYRRKGFNLQLNKCLINFVLLKGRLLQVSSTEIRRKLETGLSVQNIVPKSIAVYIKRHSLYSQPRSIIQKRDDDEINCTH